MTSNPQNLRPTPSVDVTLTVDFLHEMLEQLGYPYKHLETEGYDDALYLFEVLCGHLDSLGIEAF